MSGAVQPSEFLAEDVPMPYTMEDFRRKFLKESFPKLSPTEWAKLLQSLPPAELAEILRPLPLEERLAGITEDQIREYLDRRFGKRPAQAHEPRRKK
jgi:hypothetical protein